LSGTGLVAAIVAGGQGSRALPLTGERLPKALLPLLGVPIVVRQLEELARNDVRDVAVLAGHLAQLLVPVLASTAARLGMRVELFVEQEPRGTAGNLPAIEPFVAGRDLFVVYGDVLFDLDLARLARFHRERGALATILARPNDHPLTSDIVLQDDAGRIRRLVPGTKKDPARYYPNLVPASIYCLAARIMASVPHGARCDFVHDLFPALLDQGERLVCYPTTEYTRDIGTPAGHSAAERELAAGVPARQSWRSRRPAIFFDRDGVLNREPGGHGVLRAADLELLPGAPAAVRLANDAGWLTVLVTNQPQLAKGLTTPEELAQIHGRLESELAGAGARLDRLYHCPHHPEAGHPGEIAALKTACECRKPAPGMLRRAALELPLDLSRSVLIGDHDRDRQAALVAGVAFLSVAPGLPHAPSAHLRPVPDAPFSGVLAAVEFALAAGTVPEQPRP
jgi:mannose-1-phosphate guanylyltransferase / phosphomannomutase